MAESAVSFVVEKLGNLLIEEAVFLHDVSDQVKWIQGELQWMESFLKDADAKQEQDERVKQWVADIREAAYDAEDIIDTFIFQVASQNRQGFMGFVKRSACIFNKCIILHEVGNKIAAIRSRISEISKRKSDYGITCIDGVRGGEEGTSSSSERLQQFRRSSPHDAVDEFVVGQTEEVNSLVAELKREVERRCVVSIVGMGGLGTTTLARKIYNCSDVMGHFNCRAWVSVSQEHRTRDILQGIIRNVSSPTKEEWEAIDRMRENELERKVHDLLEGKQYLVVLDDIWSKEAWDSLKNALPNTRGNKSRVLLTTRIKEVALYADVQTHPYESRLLNEDESWELFCRKAFPENDTPSCPLSLEKYGREIVGKCHGLPLTLLVLGGLLLTKRSPTVWEVVLNNITWYLTKSEDGFVISGILGLS